ncbi:uncharacterized protein A1O9_02378 [Exophiala aquamarina CBS 119918]|uniref:Uncharacterized protein n=1 Tax=Exophiala aquamarina CBS 119918 TaxID=1182545 RepID=A0A072PLT6_9EURO|nr:uncharacterized protein A1O9_02378 [Exophiala aquamarina CBS 119918]KEF60816.1 hypothetical protein A1O9_02378 [Exophiala aquamarina CBS 119918]
MVFNPTSPIQTFGRKPLIISRTSASHGEVASIGRTSDMSEANSRRSSTLSILPAWRGGMTNNNRRSLERHDPPQEISRWSKTTTESEASNAFTHPESPTPTPSPAKKTKVLKKRLKQRKRSKYRTGSSPVDPCYDPKTKKLGLPEKPQPPVVTSPVVGPITGPDEPQSFYDSGSDDSSDAEHVLQRASSVRISKPLIVQHSNNPGGSVPKFYALQTTPTGDETLVPKPLSLGHQLTNTSSADDDARVAEDQPQALGGPQDALKTLERQESRVETMSAVSEATSEASTSPRDTLKRTILEFPSPPVGDEATDTLSTPMGGFGSLRTGKTGSYTGYSTSTYVAPSIDGLRSNPITEFDKKLSRAISAPVRHPARRVTIRPADLVINSANDDHKLFRESIVSTPYPARQNSLVEFDEQPTSQVATPRQLRRSRPLPTTTTNTNPEEAKPTAETQRMTLRIGGDEPSNKKDLPPKTPLSTKPTLSNTTSFVTPRSDRFPSPVAPEVLFLDLRLGRHPSARVTVEIEINDKTTFDDEQLFTIIRKSYNTKLLGLVRGLLIARRVSHASFSSSSSGGDDLNTPRPNSAAWPGHGQNLPTGANDFTRHLQHPPVGHRRKIWLLWLRDQQHQGALNRQQRRAERTAVPQIQQTSPLDQDESPVAISFMHPRNNSHSFSPGHSPSQNSNGSPTTATIAPSTVLHVSNACTLSRQISSAAAVAPTRPSITTPRMPFQPFHMRDKSTSSTTSSAALKNSSTSTPNSTASQSQSHTTSNITTGPPTLYLHYAFSLPRILAVFALIIAAAVFTATMWILFGVPGRSVAQGDGISMGEYGGDVQAYWRHDAHKRLVVGLLLGLVVALVGFMAEALWVWGSWILV